MKLHSTPWGSPQTQKDYAPGLVCVSTARHGGFWVSEEMLAKMPADCRETKTYAGRNWYEEDCDCSIVVLAFPEFFPESAYYFAVESCEHTDYLKHLATPERKARASAWAVANEDKWVSGGGMTKDGGWIESAYKLTDRSQRKNKWFPGIVVLPAVFTLEQFENAPLYRAA